MQNSKCKVIFILITLIVLSLLTFHFKLLTQPVSAQTCQAGTSAEGLISALSISGSFGNASQTCQQGNSNVAFVSYKIPTYNDLLSTYYTQTKSVVGVVNKSATVSTNLTNADLAFTGTDTLIHTTGNLTINGNPPATTNKTGIVFVDGSLNFSQNYTYGTNTTGTVFVVGGDVFIANNVNLINASIIAGGTVCTATSSFSPPCPPGFTTPGTVQQLVINGTLVSLTSTSPIKFRRSLTNNSVAAEKVNQDPKYLVILRDLLSQTLQKWTEFAGDEAPAASISCSNYNGNQFLCQTKGCICSGDSCTTCSP